MRSSFQIVDSTDNDDPDLITLEDLKVELGITTDDEDAALETRITRASKFMAEQCDRRFAFAHAIETFTFDRDEVLSWRQNLTLRLYPIFEFESVTAGGVELEEGVSFGFNSQNGQFWLIGQTWFGTWPGSLVVTYSGGYDLPDDAPIGLQNAVIALIRDARIATTESDSSAGALRQVTHGDLSVGYYAPSTSTGAAAGVLPSGIDDIIAFYKRRTIG